MKRDCNTCTHKEGSCYPSATIFDKNKTCRSYGPDYEGYIADLEKENTELREKLGDVQMQKAGEKSDLVWKLKTANEQKAEQLTKAKEIMNIAIEGIKHWGVVGGTERPFEKQAEKLFNLFLDKAEQFLKDN